MIIRQAMQTLNIENINSLPHGTIVTVGMFDGLHIGHRHLLRRLLENAETCGLKPIVVTFDRHPRLVMDPDANLELLSTYDEKLEWLEECGVPTVVMIHFTRETAELSACDFASQFLCNKLNMKQLLLGYDNMFGSRRNNDFDRIPELAAERGFEICRDEAVLLNGIDVSSTKIRHALRNGDLDTANAMLGCPYRLSGSVVHGRHVGTLLGFPTANIQPDDSNKILPAPGVYALRAKVRGKTWRAMANLGVQPTFHSDKAVLEVHLIDFEGNLYGEKVQVEFVARIRDIKHFNSSKELAFQLLLDKSEAEKRLTI